jgi:hypothetical protein
MSPAKQFWAGDAPQLVDALIASCQQAIGTQAMPGEGRELVPWTDDSCVGSSSLLNMPLENRRQSKFPARHARSPTAAAATAAAQERSANKRSKVAASPTHIPRAASNGGGRRLSAENAPAGFACPAVAASPKPETLPMPTGLMSRAVRSRSPSPPKDSFFAVSVLAHVHPVAA